MKTFIELCHAYRIPYRTEGKHSRPGWVQIDCPFCGPSSGKFHLGFNTDQAYFNCWRCGSHGNINTLAEILRTPKGKAADILKGLDKSPISKIKYSGNLQLPCGVGSLEGPHIEYLRSRKFNPEKIKQWGIQGIGRFGDRLAWSLFIPIIYRGEMVSWTTRKIDPGGGPRYMTAPENSESVPAKSILYGVDFCQNTIVICEGPTDAWRLGPGTVATMGIVYSQEQMARMTQFPVRAICFDNEPPAQLRARKLMRELEPFQGVTLNIILDSPDPGSASKKETRELREYVASF